MKSFHDGENYSYMSSPKSGIPKQFEKLIGNCNIISNTIHFKNRNEFETNEPIKPLIIQPKNMNMSEERGILRSRSNKRSSYSSQNYRKENSTVMKNTISQSAKKSTTKTNFPSSKENSESKYSIAKSQDFKYQSYSRRAFAERIKTEDDKKEDIKYLHNHINSESKFEKARNESLENLGKTSLLTRSSNLRNSNTEKISKAGINSNSNLTSRSTDQIKNKKNLITSENNFSFLNQVSRTNYRTSANKGNMDSKIDNNSWHGNKESKKTYFSKGNFHEENVQKREIKSTSVDRYNSKNLKEDIKSSNPREKLKGSFKQEEPTEMFEIHDISEKLHKLENRIIDIKKNIESKRPLNSRASSSTRKPFESNLKIKDERRNFETEIDHNKTEETYRLKNEDRIRISELVKVHENKIEGLQHQITQNSPRKYNESNYSKVLKNSLNGYFTIQNQNEKRESITFIPKETSVRQSSKEKISVKVVEKRSSTKSEPNNQIRSFLNKKKEVINVIETKLKTHKHSNSDSKKSSIDKSYTKNSKNIQSSKDLDIEAKIKLNYKKNENEKSCLIKRIDIMELKNNKGKSNQKGFEPKKSTISLKDFCTQVSQNIISVASKPLEKDLQIHTSTLSKEKLNKENEEKYHTPFYIYKLIYSFINYSIDDYFLNLYRVHFVQCMQASVLVSYFKQPTQFDLNDKFLNLQQKEKYRCKKTLIFDLDETLVHCNENGPENSDMVIPIQFPTGDIIQAGINIRPHAFQILEDLSEFYEIIIFTASHSCYADQVLNRLDPNSQFIQHRLYREHCIFTDEGLYVKDLRVINRNMKDMILVDNALYSFGYQLENGVPILPFYHNKDDDELVHLNYYLKSIAHCADVRYEITKTLRISEFNKYSQPVDLIENVFPDYIKNIK